MANMSALYIGLSGLTNSSNALNTTANNMSNVNTKGYVRQQVVFEDTQYNVLNRFATATLQRGNGVTIQQVSHVRDILLDEAYRRENGRYGFYRHSLASSTEYHTRIQYRIFYLQSTKLPRHLMTTRRELHLYRVLSAS